MDLSYLPCYFKSKITAFVLATTGRLAFKAETAFALRIDLDRPGLNEFVRDLPRAKTDANELSDSLITID